MGTVDRLSLPFLYLISSLSQIYSGSFHRRGLSKELLEEILFAKKFFGLHQFPHPDYRDPHNVEFKLLLNQNVFSDVTLMAE